MFKSENSLLQIPYKEPYTKARVSEIRRDYEFQEVD